MSHSLAFDCMSVEQSCATLEVRTSQLIGLYNQLTSQCFICTACQSIKTGVVLLDTLTVLIPLFLYGYYILDSLNSHNGLLLIN